MLRTIVFALFLMPALICSTLGRADTAPGATYGSSAAVSASLRECAGTALGVARTDRMLELVQKRVRYQGKSGLLFFEQGQPRFATCGNRYDSFCEIELLTQSGSSMHLMHDHDHFSVWQEERHSWQHPDPTVSLSADQAWGLLRQSALEDARAALAEGLAESIKVLAGSNPKGGYDVEILQSALLDLREVESLEREIESYADLAGSRLDKAVTLSGKVERERDAMASLEQAAKDFEAAKLTQEASETRGQLQEAKCRLDADEKRLARRYPNIADAIAAVSRLKEIMSKGEEDVIQALQNKGVQATISEMANFTIQQSTYQLEQIRQGCAKASGLFNDPAFGQELAELSAANLLWFTQDVAGRARFFEKRWNAALSRWHQLAERM